LHAGVSSQSVGPTDAQLAPASNRQGPVGLIMRAVRFFISEPADPETLMAALTLARRKHTNQDAGSKAALELIATYCESRN
jgi:hypothetical protein